MEAKGPPRGAYEGTGAGATLIPELQRERMRTRVFQTPKKHQGNRGGKAVLNKNRNSESTCFSTLNGHRGADPISFRRLKKKKHAAER